MNLFQNYENHLYNRTMNTIKLMCKNCFQSHPFLQFIFFWMLTISFTLIVHPTISPLNPFYFRGDTSIFYLIGACWTEGVMPYRDLFDHKGPFLYLIYSLGEIIWSGKTGVFLLLNLFLSASFFLIYKTSRLYISPVSSVIVTLLYIVSIGGILGGYTEDFSLPFIVWPLFIMLRHLRRGKTADLLPVHSWVIIGACFAFISLLRLNNAALVCGLVLSYGFIMMRNKQFFGILRASLFFIIGVILVLLPIALLLSCQGILEDAIFCSYTFNFKYASAGILEKDWMDIVRLVNNSLCVWFILGVGYWLRKQNKLSKEEYFCLVFASIIAVVCLFPGRGYSHYFTFASPCLACSFILVAMLVEYYASPKAFLCGGVSWFVLAGYSSLFTLIIFRYGTYCSFFPEMHRTPRAEIQLMTDAEAIGRLIPDTEKDKAIVYGGMANVYHYTGCKPHHCFFFLQNFIVNNAPELKEVLHSQYNLENAPLWIIFEKKDESSCRQGNPALDDYLRSYCERVEYGGTFETLNLYKRKF